MRSKLKQLKRTRYITLLISLACIFIGTYMLTVTFCPWIQFIFYSIAIFCLVESQDAKVEHNTIVENYNNSFKQ